MDGAPAYGMSESGTTAKMSPFKTTMVRASSLLFVHAEGHFAEALAGGGEDGVGDGGTGDEDAGFAEAVGLVVAFDEMGFERRGFGDAEDAVVVEVLLLDCAVADGNGFFEDRAEGKEHAAFELMARAVGVDDLAAVDGGDEAIDTDGVALDRDFGDLSEIGVVGGAGDATAAVGTERRAPVGFFGSEIEDGDEAVDVRRGSLFF